ncbi:YgaP family membrane protein [Ramlibacter sp.]|uniref:YgaP family membrane protein n=1 Tax=Ramlibacter sp. TaxID=1917967 RepID=UPI002FC9E7B3
MKVNEGAIDRGLRIVAGLVLIGLAATGTVGAWGYIGIIPLLTGAIGMCPIYSLLGINTCPTSRG